MRFSRTSRLAGCFLIVALSHCAHISPAPRDVLFKSGVRCVRPPESFESSARAGGSVGYQAADLIRAEGSYHEKFRRLDRLSLPFEELRHALFLLCVDYGNGLVTREEYQRWREVLERKHGGAASAGTASTPTATPIAAPGTSLAVTLWTEKAEYRAGEKIRVFFRGNRPFYARVLYRDAAGNMVQILPNPHRQENRFEGGTAYALPGAGDKFELEVSPPFGTESVLLFASDSPLGDVDVAPAGAVYAVNTSDVGEVKRRSRGIVIKPAAGATTPPPAARREFTHASTALLTLPR